MKSPEWRLGRTNHADGADRFIHCDGNIAERRIVYGAIKFVGPTGIGEEALHTQLQFLGGLLLADSGCQTASDLRTALRKIFGDVVKNLRAIVRRGFRPGFRFARRLHGISNVFAVPKRRFAEELAVFSPHFDMCSRSLGALACRQCKASPCDRPWDLRLRPNRCSCSSHFSESAPCGTKRAPDIRANLLRHLHGRNHFRDNRQRTGSRSRPQRQLRHRPKLRQP